jgi:hypothetical protein
LRKDQGDDESRQSMSDFTVGFAERLLEIIDSGRRTATYKLALVLALLDLCARLSDEEGRAPTELRTRDVAEEVASLYWPQVMPFRLDGSDAAPELRQITNKRSTIIDPLRTFRRTAEAIGATSLWLARRRLPGEYEAIIDRIEQTLAKQPLPRLQTVGSSETIFPFIYDLGPLWSADQNFTISRLRRAGPRGPVIPLLPGAGDELLRLSALIRPLVEMHWTQMVARLNKVSTVEEDLRQHLFGSPRVAPSRLLRDGLKDLRAEDASTVQIRSLESPKWTTSFLECGVALMPSRTSSWPTECVTATRVICCRLPPSLASGLIEI